MYNVLILTRPDDKHMPPVAEEIRRRGREVVCFNLADFPEEIAMEAKFEMLHEGWSSVLSYQQQHIPLDSLVSVWRRRPTPYKASQEYPLGERTFIEEEADRAFLGVLDSLTYQDTLWVSRTHSVRRADLKALQLAVAQQVGLRVPRTLITNSSHAIQEFYATCKGNVILKSVSRGTIENEDSQIGSFIYTSKIEQQHLVNLEGVHVTAHLLQEHIPKKFEVRVVVIGRQIFAAEIHSPHLDFRQEYHTITYEVHQLPEDIQKKVLNLVRQFDLQFSSMDMLVTHEGEYVFLDLNPNGQFMWLQHHLLDRLPLKEAMADLLVYPKDYYL